jgi:hypothetical protein
MWHVSSALRCRRQRPSVLITFDVIWHRLDASCVEVTFGAIRCRLEASCVEVTFSAIRHTESPPSDLISPRCAINFSANNANVCHMYHHIIKVRYSSL